MPWVVTRQSYSSMGENANVVEVCGTVSQTRYSIDNYSNPGALVAKYTGEFETFDNPIAAAAAAISIYHAWKADGGKRLSIRHGFTGGSTMPFDAPEHGAGIRDIEAYAKEAYDLLPKCPVCGDIMGKETYISDFLPDEKICSENCCYKLEEDAAEENDRAKLEDEQAAQSVIEGDEQ